MYFDFGLSIEASNNPLGLSYGKNCFGPEVEKRMLNDIRHSLRNPNCAGPDTVYAIAMDVGKWEDKNLLQDKMLLFGVVTYSPGRLGDEPVKSQGHTHKISLHSGWSPPEVYEIWSGTAVIYMQEYAANNPGRCFAVYANKGDVVIVPPLWAHATINADPGAQLTFGAWCDREYGFSYEAVKERKGLAWYPIFNDKNELTWQPNPLYQPSELITKQPQDYYDLLGIEKNIPIYEQFQKDPDRFQFVSQPALKKNCWGNFIP